MWRHAQVCAEVVLDGSSVELRIAVGVEQAGLGGEQRSRAVDVDRPALHHDSRGEDREGRAPAAIRVGIDVVEVVRRILAAPGVVVPVDDRLLAAVPWRALQENRAVVPAPGVVGGMVVEEDVAAVGALICQEPPDVELHSGAGHVDVHLLVIGEVAHHPGEDRRHRAELAGPGCLLVRPAEPGAAVRLPLGRHAIAELGRRTGQLLTHSVEIALRDVARRRRSADRAGRASGCGSHPPCRGPVWRSAPLRRCRP